jgi:hypothetical protein
MRKVIDVEAQIKFGQVDISAIRLDFRCRDEIPQLLMGLKHLYENLQTRKEVFSILETEVPTKNIRNGRPGMHLWTILVLASLRVNCNWDWDKIHFMANTHGLIRQMMGIGEWDGQVFFLQAIKDNVALLKVETVNKISTLTVKEGHNQVKKKNKNELRARCDSFVNETNVHYSTDIDLLLDAMRKVIFLVACLCVRAGIPGWRKYSENFRKVKGLFRQCQKLKHSTAKHDGKKKEREDLIIEAHLIYLDIALSFLSRAQETLADVSASGDTHFLAILEIERYITHAERQIEQVKRRVVTGETIPHDQKVFSIFEEHTEWISKGKAGVPVELGLRVCILEDQYGFILHHRVMQKEVDGRQGA